MRTSIILVRKHGETTFKMVAGPEVSILNQEGQMREAALSGASHPEIAEIQNWICDPNARVLKFQNREVMKANREKVNADYAAHLERTKSPSKKAKFEKEAAEKLAQENAKKNTAAHDEATAKALENKKKQEELAEKNIAAHKKATAENDAKWRAAQAAKPVKAPEAKPDPKPADETKAEAKAPEAKPEDQKQAVLENELPATDL
jgi:hypothetical protein